MAASLKKNDEGHIDLVNCVDDDEDDSPSTVEVIDLCSENLTRQAKPKAKKPRLTSNTDAIVIDQTKKREELSEEEKYRHAVGPTRMAFIETWTSAHHFGSSTPSHRLPRTLYNELLEFQLNLPISKNSSIFIRAQESRLDLLRCMITGPVDTPYALGCFFFDVHLNDYPQKAPKVKFLTTDSARVRFNPNLYKCGKVCLSLLGTWSGPGWVSGQSTLLQVLVSIQALILVAEPYFNEPGYENSRHTPAGQQQSNHYSAQVRRDALRVAIAAPLAQVVRSMVCPYPEFAGAVRVHFEQQAEALREQVEDWVQKDPSLKTLGATVVRDIETLVSQRQRAAEPIEIE